MLIVLFAACIENEEVASTSTDTCAQNFDTPLQTGRGIAACIPAIWEAYEEEPFAPFTVTAFYSNVSMDPIDPEHLLADGEVIGNVFAWSVNDWTPEWYVNEDLVASITAYADAESLVADVTAVRSFTLPNRPGDDFDGVYFVESVDGFVDGNYVYPGTTAVQLYIDLHNGNVLNLSGVTGGATEDLTENSDSWPPPLQTYWSVIMGMEVVPFAEPK